MFVAILFGFGIALTIVLARPAAAGGDGGNVTLSGKSNAKIVLTLGTSDVALTGVDPACAPVSGVTGYSGSQASDGCAYSWPISVQVHSNRAWTGSIYGQDDDSATSDINFDGGAFRASTSDVASYADCGGAQIVPEGSEADDGWKFESAGKKGNTKTVHYHCVLVDWDDDDGTIDSTLSYSVSQ